MTLRFVEPGPGAGFEHPYVLHVPPHLERSDPVPILVESTSVPRATDDFEAIRGEAERRVSRGFGRAVADELSVPFLHPVFPRPLTEPVDWTHLTHSLDRETLRIEGGPLERIDLQLLAMIEDAREHLADAGVEVQEDFLMNGFSASGVFANRFTALHPERVISVTAGGINGMAILPATVGDVPIDGVEKRILDYPVGVADVRELTGEPFDSDAFRDVHQFLYLGEEDDSDTLLYPDAWTGPEIRLTAVFAYGEDIHRDRFPHCAAVYEEDEVDAVFRTYENAAHDPTPAFDDVVTFHERTLSGDDIDDIRADLGGNDL